MNNSSITNNYIIFVDILLFVYYNVSGEHNYSCIRIGNLIIIIFRHAMNIDIVSNKLCYLLPLIGLENLISIHGGIICHNYQTTGCCHRSDMVSV